MFEIKHRDGHTLHVITGATTLAKAIKIAVRQRLDLSGARLDGA